MEKCIAYFKQRKQKALSPEQQLDLEERLSEIIDSEEQKKQELMENPVYAKYVKLLKNQVQLSIIVNIIEFDNDKNVDLDDIFILAGPYEVAQYRKNDINEYTLERMSIKERRGTIGLYNPFKAAVLCNLQILCSGLEGLTSKLLFNRHPDMEPTQFLFGRSVLTTILTLIYINKQTRNVLGEPCRKQVLKKFIFGISLQIILVTIDFTCIKYISLVIVQLVMNMCPIITVFLSYCLLKEKFTKNDIVVVLIIIAGATMIAVSYKDRETIQENQDKKNELGDAGDAHSQEPPPIWVLMMLGFLPFFLASTSILWRQMRHLNSNTQSLYANPTLGIIMFIALTSQGLSVSYFFDGRMNSGDLGLFIFHAIACISKQMFRMNALKYDVPGKLAHYQYTAALYQLIFDTTIFHQFFPILQQIGISVMFLGYAIKFFHIIRENRLLKQLESENDPQKKNNEVEDLERQKGNYDASLKKGVEERMKMIDSYKNLTIETEKKKKLEAEKKKVSDEKKKAYDKKKILKEAKKVPIKGGIMAWNK